MGPQNNQSPEILLTSRSMTTSPIVLVTIKARPKQRRMTTSPIVIVTMKARQEQWLCILLRKKRMTTTGSTLNQMNRIIFLVHLVQHSVPVSKDDTSGKVA
eukprot:scaffold137862_cov63-Cyclotella_meneghiniana.AAC.1